MNDCIFCKIANKEIPGKIIYEDEKLIGILDINPICDGHVLLIPKKHISDFFELDHETLTHMYDISKQLSKKLMNIFKDENMTFSINYGRCQSVKHLHLHLMPDYTKKASLSIDEIYKKFMDE